MTLLDVTKAYDKEWAEGILYVLEKRGLKNRLWKKFKVLNGELMKDNIRQGGGMYATLMDEIAKEVKHRQLGVDKGNGKKIACLLWMDDVVFISKNNKEMLDDAEESGSRYRIKFGGKE